jgi:DNA-binding transcriptional regulator YiaG
MPKKEWKFNPDKVKQCRQEKNLSLHMFGKFLGKKPAHQIQDWESGDVLPSSANLVLLCNRCKKTPNFFFSE